MVRAESPKWPEKVLLASPRGFCAGVVRAVDIVNIALERSQGEPVYVYHEIIHNTHVVRDFKERNAKFVNSIDEVPEGAIFVPSAHGVEPAIIDLAEQRRMRVIDATCPLVAKTHMEAKKFLAEGRTVLYIGHANHDETVGTLGHAPQIRLIEKAEDVDNVEVEDPEKVALITQTTLSMDDTAKIREAILKRFPNIAQPRTSDICFATQNRQSGVKEMIDRGAERIVVLGSPTSSNSIRMREVAETAGASAFFVDEAKLLVPDLFRQFKCVGLTSGASAPDDKFQEIVEFFRVRGSKTFENVVVAEEKYEFGLPKGLDKLQEAPI